MNNSQKYFNKKLGSKLRRIREQKGITISILAKKSAVNEKYIGKIERGECSPSLYIIKKVSSGLKIKLNQLIEML
jgi:transcriptional regulator with XRE-family HTH domain